MPKLQPYGSKLRPYGSRPAQPDPMAALLKEQAELIAEEARLYAIVDKYDRNGKGSTDKAYEARRAWNVIWRKIDRLDSTMHSTIARSMSNGKV